MKKVDFFIVGAPKAGTTSLYHYLDAHPDIEMSSKKEPDFFSDADLQKQRMYYSEVRINNLSKYNALFKQEDVQLRGEASVSYLYYPDVPSKIKEYNSEAKIIIMLRNPIDRAFSHYLMDYRLGLVTDSFETIINNKSKHKNAHLHYQQYLSVSEYSSQIERYLDVFGKNKVHIIDYENFKNNTAEIIKEVFSFLGLNSDFSLNLSKKYNLYSMPKNRIIRYIYSFVMLRRIFSFLFPKKIVQYIRGVLFRVDKKPKISAETRDFLIEFFHNDIQNLSRLLNKDFTKWIK